MSKGQQLYLIEGRITDAATSEPMPSANIRLGGTTRGTISNLDGAYLMRIPEGPNTLIFSFIGYISDTLQVDVRDDLVCHVELHPTMIEMPMLTVSAVDLASSIIRRAIEAKERLNEGLESYRFHAFTRRTISREDSIAGIMEGYSNGYWKQGETLREEISQFQATENLPDLGELQGVLEIVDFSRDDVVFAENRYVGPLHPNAFRWYEYEIEEVNLQDGREIYRIAMEPRNRLIPLLRGTVDIADSTWALVGIDLEPAEEIVFPFVNDLLVRWKQSFRLQEGFWLPNDIRIEGGVEVGLGPIKIPRIGFSQTSVIYDYDVNTVIQDSIFTREESVVQLPSASVVDSTFWEENEVLPMTIEEEYAYTTLDSTETLEVLFAPPGWEMDAGSDELVLRGSVGGGDLVGSLLGVLDTRFNRVEGYVLGVRASRDSILGRFEIDAGAGYAFSTDRWNWQATISTRFGTRPRGPNQPGSRGVGISMSFSDGVARSPSAGFYPVLLNTLSTTFFQDDYYDYHASRGWRLDVNPVDRSALGIDLHLTRAKHRSLDAMKGWSISNRDGIPRPNPPVTIEGADWTRYGGMLRIGRPESAASVSPGRGILIGVERGEASGGDPSIPSRQRIFTRADGVLSFSFLTFTTRYLFSPMMVVRFGGGVSDGSLPRELWGGPENALGYYSPLGTLRGADHRELAGTDYVVLTAEHNFRSQPFQLLGFRWLYEQGIELYAHAGIAQSWRHGVKVPQEHPYREVGFGIGRIAELFRLDLTHRLSGPAGWYLTLTLTTFL
ncbi:DUF5686 family protein [Gemmatimonadota bacterium]